jgi:hypothetical protein
VATPGPSKALTINRSSPAGSPVRIPISLSDWLQESPTKDLLPDFVLAFAFFASLVYATLAKRVGHQRSAIAMSAAVGLALSVGLVWWEKSTGFSIRDLGPIAIGFAIILLAFVMYQSIRQVGGTWSGAAITLGASATIAKLLGIPIPVNADAMQTLASATIIVGVLGFMLHYRRHLSLPNLRSRVPEIKPDLSRLYRERHLSNELERRLNDIRQQSNALAKRPDKAADVVRQIREILPAEGYLTERMVQLRAKAHGVRNGHIARLEETRYVFARLPTSAKKKAAAELAAGYDQIIGMDTRLERLDKAVAENERRIRELTRDAQERAARYDHRGLVDCLKNAEKLQKHNSRLFRIMKRTEGKLTALLKQIAARAEQVDQP